MEITSLDHTEVHLATGLDLLVGSAVDSQSHPCKLHHPRRKRLEVDLIESKTQRNEQIQRSDNNYLGGSISQQTVAGGAEGRGDMGKG
ncbi:hypothetical protein BDW69DRAFT_100587 [Aspergillus filifer]